MRGDGELNHRGTEGTEGKEDERGGGRVLDAGYRRRGWSR
jgi:hypothetical protein